MPNRTPKPKPIGRSHYLVNGLAIRSPQQIADELHRRTGERISDSLVWFELQKAHRKIAAALADRSTTNPATSKTRGARM